MVQSDSAFLPMRNSLILGQWFAQFVISPRVVRVIEAEGYSKSDVRQYFYDHCWVPASVIEEHVNGFRGRLNWSLKEQVEQGKIPAEYEQSDDPNRLVRMFMYPDWMGIVLAGDRARNESRACWNNMIKGLAVSRAVNLPSQWERLIRKDV